MVGFLFYYDRILNMNEKPILPKEEDIKHSIIKNKITSIAAAGALLFAGAQENQAQTPENIQVKNQTEKESVQSGWRPTEAGSILDITGVVSRLRLRIV